MTAVRPSGRPGPLRPPVRWLEQDAPPSGSPTGDAGSRPARSRGTTWGLVGSLVIVGAMVQFAYGDTLLTRSLLPALVVIPLLVLLAAPVLARARALEPGFDLAGIMLVSLGLKCIGAYYRIVIASDALEYDAAGVELARRFRRLDFFVDAGAEVPGTGTIRYLTGLVHVATGSTFVATFLVFTFVSWLGLYFFYRAFRTGLPDGDRRRYALLVFLWPSLLFWPSSLGKEAVLLTAIGLASWGAARLLARERGGLLLLALGVGGAAMVRPHVAMIVLIAVTAAILLRRGGDDHVARLAAKLGVVAVLLVGGAVLATATADFLELDDLGTTALSDALDTTELRTAQGNSAFSPATVSQPLDYPWAVVTVLVRPFPGETSGVEGLLSGLEGLLFVGLVVASARRLSGIVRQSARHPYLVYTLAFVAVFVFAFAVIANFGILVRQRTVATALVLVPLALPLPPDRRRPAAPLADDGAGHADTAHPTRADPPPAAPAPPVVRLRPPPARPGGGVR